MSDPNTKTLDHIVHLTPPGSVSEASEQFRKLGFTVLPGGNHTDGLTANALVVLADNVYLELISFTHPQSYYPPGSPERKKRDSHPWASKPPGWIDFAFLGNGSLTPGKRISDLINARARTALYDTEQPGGRQRPDGKVLKWLISAPSRVRGHGGGTLPFFCGDVTPREWRVPEHPQHLSTAYGISHIRILTSSKDFAHVSDELTSVIGDAPKTSTETEITWRLNTLQTDGDGPLLILNSPGSEEEAEFVTQQGTGIHEVGFRVKNGKAGKEKTPYGDIVWVPDNKI